MIAKAIEHPTSHWPGQCYSVAQAALEAYLFPDCILRYGHYYGPVHERCHTFNRRRPFQRHAWLERPDTLVVDLTRWVFEALPPYIYTGPGAEYDAGGRRMSESINGKFEDRDPGGPFVNLEMLPTPVMVLRALTNHGGGNKHRFTCSVDQLCWIANLDPFLLEASVQEIYNAIRNAGHKALIPFDHWEAIMVNDRPYTPEKPKRANRVAKKCR
jgi:hypothetical protein